MITVPTEALRRAWALPAEAEETEIAAAIASRPALPPAQRKAAEVVATHAPVVSAKTRASEAADEASHRAFMANHFPAVASGPYQSPRARIQRFS